MSNSKKDLFKTSGTNSVKFNDQEIKETAVDTLIQNVHQAIKLFLSEQKRMWHSVYDYIEMVEREQTELERLVQINETNHHASIKQEKQLYDKIECDTDDQMNCTFTLDEKSVALDGTFVMKEFEEIDAFNSTFTKAEIENNDSFGEIYLQYSMSEQLDQRMNSQLNEQNNLTPIPKTCQRRRSLRNNSIISSSQSLPVIDEFSISHFSFAALN